MKIFLAFKFTGVEQDIIQEEINHINEGLQHLDYDIFYSLTKEDFFQNNNFSREDIYQYCYNISKQSDILLFFINHQEKSEGMERELNDAVKINKKIVLLIKKIRL